MRTSVIRLSLAAAAAVLPLATLTPAANAAEPLRQLALPGSHRRRDGRLLG